MQIKSTITNKSGKVFNFVYKDIEDDSEIKDIKFSGVHSICFCGDKMVVVYSEKKGYWTPPGGGVDGDETVAEAAIREVKEETNMKVLKQKFIGYQEIHQQDGVINQARSICIVEPYGEFLGDPADGEITEIKLIDPKDYKKYFDWGEIGERIMQRALEIKNTI